MKKQLSTATAALLASFMAACTLQEQETAPPPSAPESNVTESQETAAPSTPETSVTQKQDCKERNVFVEGFARVDEKLIAFGVIPVKGPDTGEIVPDKTKIFELYGDKTLGSWSALLSSADGKSCMVDWGENLKIMSSWNRAKGLEVQFRPPMPLDEMEKNLKSNGEVLQITANLSDNTPIRIYADTDPKNPSWTVIGINESEKIARIIYAGSIFPALELVAEYVKSKENVGGPTVAPP